MNTLPSVRYYTSGDIYHYEVDNRPLSDLAARDDSLRTAINALEKNSRLGSLVDSFIARGLATQNTMVGKLSFNATMTFSVTRAFLTQEIELDPVNFPGEILPAIGVTTEPESFLLTNPGAGYIRPFSIQARRKAASTDLPVFYDASQSSYNDVADIEYQMLVGTDVGANPVYPAVTPGWIEIFRIATTSTTTNISEGLITKVNFIEEGDFAGSGGGTGVYEYLHEQIIVTGAPTSEISGVGINCNYAFVFVDKAIQFNVSRINASTVQFSEPLPVGTVVDFIVTAGGIADPASPSQIYQVFTASGGQTVFPGVLAKDATALVFIDGAFQERGTWGINDGTGDLTLDEACAAGEKVIVFELKAIGSGGGTGAPVGGTTGQVLTKITDNDHDYDWQDVSTRGVPIGAIVTFPMTTLESGFLYCDGAVYLRATYPDLFAKIGTTYNIGGETSLQFRVPDLRGEFIRGWDHGRGVDPGRAFASAQSYQNASHRHNIELLGGTSGFMVDAYGTGPTVNGRSIDSGVTTSSYEVIRTDLQGGTETRPRNVAMMYAIKAYDSVFIPAEVAVEDLIDNAIDTALSTLTLAKAFVMFNGSNASVSRSNNIASISKLGSGKFRVTFSTTITNPVFNITCQLDPDEGGVSTGDGGFNICGHGPITDSYVDVYVMRLVCNNSGQMVTSFTDASDVINVVVY